MLTRELLKYQAKQIKHGGLAVLLDKTKNAFDLIGKILWTAVKTIIFSPIYIVLVIISPILLVRIGEIETRAIGHFSLPIEIYLCEQKVGINKLKRWHIDIWFINKKIANAVLLAKWRTYLTVCPRFILNPLFDICRWAPGGKQHKVPYRHWMDRNEKNKLWQVTDIYDVLPKVEPMVNFSADETQNSEGILSSIGILSKTSYICFNARNPGYLSESEFGPRDSSIHTQVPAMQAMIGMGYKAIRVGSVVSEDLDEMYGMIDYSNSGKRSELVDLFLISRCRFMVSTASGIDCLATIFRRPTVYVNLCDFGNCQAFNGRYNPIFIPKKFLRGSNQKIMTFSEIYENEIDLFANAERFKAAGFHWLDNEGDEVKDVVLEMENRLSGTWIETEEDIALQKKFWDIFTVYRGQPPAGVRIGADFLRKNKDLLT
jgi:putative glycosyltransferase (TIGR04372 family)